MSASLFTLVLVAVLAYPVNQAQAEVFRYTDENGKIVYTDVAPPVTFTSATVDVRPNSVAGPAYTDSGQKSVVMYSAEWCGICKQAREYFEGRGIEYEEYDIDTDEKGKRDFAEMRGRGVPIILVGDQRMRGFNPTRFQDLFREM